ALEGSALLAFPAAVAFLVLGVPICEALYRGLASDALALFGGRGSAFTARDAAQTGAALALFGAGLPAFVWHKVLSPAYYAREDTKTPMRYALIAIAVNTVLALALFPLVGFLGVPLATSIAAWVQVALLAGGLSRSGGLALTARLVGRLARTAGASVALAAFLAACAPYTERYAALTFGREWVAVVLLCGAGLALYGLAALALGAVRLSDYKRATAT
ncbi:MAG: lipid II flippase MurJ, partial [Pseudomonadota bacterium]